MSNSDIELQVRKNSMVFMRQFLLYQGLQMLYWDLIKQAIRCVDLIAWIDGIVFKAREN